jgi:hypothetical protein
MSVLTPTELPLAGCPINPRPRDQRTYSAACHAAQGEAVQEFDACEIVTGMRAWCGSRFLAVVNVRHLTVGDIVDPSVAGETSRRHPFVLLRLADQGGTGWIIGEVDAPVYVLA